jgi:hypothetical protein
MFFMDGNFPMQSFSRFSSFSTPAGRTSSFSGELNVFHYYFNADDEQSGKVFRVLNSHCDGVLT